MNTPSHMLINAALGRRDGVTGPKWRGWLWGSFAPDIPLYVLTLLSAIYYPLLENKPFGQSMEYIFDVLFFEHPLWKATHNLLHAPVILALIALVAWRYKHTARGLWWLWFAAGCFLHTTIDLLTHADDGPLIFFPFDWNSRFYSPISYWDPRHGGNQFAIFELGLDLILALYLLLKWWQKRQQVAV